MQEQPDPERLVPDAERCRLDGISGDTLNRRRQRGEASPPDIVIRGRNYTKASTLRRDRERLMQLHAPVNITKATADGRAKFWADVKAKKRPHPRTIGAARRKAAQEAKT